MASRPGENIPISYPEVILCVEIYHPKKYGAKVCHYNLKGSFEKKASFQIYPLVEIKKVLVLLSSSV